MATLILIPLRDGAPKYTYEGENNKAGIVAFMKNPGKAPEKPKEEVWADTPSDVIHLTDATFHEFVKVTLLSVFITVEMCCSILFISSCKYYLYYFTCLILHLKDDFYGKSRKVKPKVKVKIEFRRILLIRSPLVQSTQLLVFLGGARPKITSHSGILCDPLQWEVVFRACAKWTHGVGIILPCALLFVS